MDQLTQERFGPDIPWAERHPEPEPRRLVWNSTPYQQERRRRELVEAFKPRQAPAASVVSLTVRAA